MKLNKLIFPSPTSSYHIKTFKNLIWIPKEKT